MGQGEAGLSMHATASMAQKPCCKPGRVDSVGAAVHALPTRRYRSRMFCATARLAIASNMPSGLHFSSSS